MTLSAVLVDFGLSPSYVSTFCVKFNHTLGCWCCLSPVRFTILMKFWKIWCFDVSLRHQREQHNLVFRSENFIFTAIYLVKKIKERREYLFVWFLLVAFGENHHLGMKKISFIEHKNEQNDKGDSNNENRKENWTRGREKEDETKQSKVELGKVKMHFWQSEKRIKRKRIRKAKIQSVKKITDQLLALGEVNVDPLSFFFCLTHI